MVGRLVSARLAAVVAVSGLSLVACGGGGEEPTDGGTQADTNATTPDTSVEDGGGRDAGVRTDGGVDTTELENTTFDSFASAYCTCLVESDPTLSLDDCLESLAGDTIIQPCDDQATRSTDGLFDRYIYCRVDAFTAAETCIEESDCSETALDACLAPFQTANMACPDLIPEAALTAYRNEFEMCLDDGFRGPPGECPESLTAVSDVGASVFSGTTTMAGDDTAPDCDDTEGSYAPDRGFLWEAPEAGVYTIDTIGSEFDTILYVRTACLAATSIACNDDVEAGIMRQSTLDVTMTAGQQIVIIVDGWRNENGNFVVNITQHAAPPMDAGTTDVDAGTPEVDAAADDVDAAVDDVDAGVGG